MGDFGVQKGCGEAIIGRETRGLERGEKRGDFEGAREKRVRAWRGDGGGGDSWGAEVFGEEERGVSGGNWAASEEYEGGVQEVWRGVVRRK